MQTKLTELSASLGSSAKVKFKPLNIDSMTNEDAQDLSKRKFDRSQKGIKEMFSKKASNYKPKFNYYKNKSNFSANNKENYNTKGKKIEQNQHDGPIQQTLIKYAQGQIEDSENGKKRIIFEVVSDNNIALKFYNFFNNALKEIVKRVNRARFDNDEHCWVFPNEHYLSLKFDIKSVLDPDVEIQDIPDFITRLLRFSTPYPNITRENYNYAMDKVNKYSLNNLPESLLSRLLNFQKNGVEYCIDRCGRAIIGDEMGVGKTVQAISTAFIYKDDWPVLIICPSSIKLIWKHELLKWLPGEISEGQIQVFSSGKDGFIKDSKVFIFSYELATKMSESIDHMEFKVVIADEAHYLKSNNAKRSKLLLPIFTKAKRVLLLTGTPILSRPIELYNLVKTLRPDMIRNFMDYANRYCNPRENSFGMDFNGASCMKELHYVLEKAFMIRRLKKEVLSELPDKRRQKIDIQPEESYIPRIRKILVEQLQEIRGRSQDQEKHFESMFSKTTEEFESKLQKESVDGGFKRFDTPFEELSYYFVQAYQLTADSKIKGILDFISTLIENDTKFLIFAHHKSVMDAIEVFCNKRKVKSIRIDGSTKSHIRHDLVTQFQSDEGTKIAILSITACSHGLTLTASSTVVFAELFWTPGIMIQAEDRVHRIGQTNSVSIYYLYAEETLDEIMLSMIMSKSTVISSTLDGINKSDYTLKGFDKKNFSMVNELDRFCSGDHINSNPREEEVTDEILSIRKIAKEEYEEVINTSSKMKKRNKKEISKKESDELVDNYGFGEAKHKRKTKAAKDDELDLNESECVPIDSNFMTNILSSCSTDNSISTKYTKKMNKLVNDIDKKRKKQKKAEADFVDEDSDVADEMFDMFLDEIRETNENKTVRNQKVIKNKSDKNRTTPKIQREGFLNNPRERENKINMNSFTPFSKKENNKKQKRGKNIQVSDSQSPEISI